MLTLPKLCLLSLSLIVSACGSGSIVIKDERPCAVAGRLADGGICTHTLSSETNNLSLNEMIDFLEPQPARHCVPVPGMTICADDQSQGTAVDLPARGGAIAESSEDWKQRQVELEQACRLLGKKCKLDTRTAISGMGNILRVMPSPRPGR